MATRKPRCAAARLAERLAAEGHPVSERTVNRLLHALGYSLRGNRRTPEGRQHPDRDARFRRFDRRVRAFQRLGQPVVSVDTRKKEIVGQYRNGGRAWRPGGEPKAVRYTTSRIRTSAMPSALTDPRRLPDTCRAFRIGDPERRFPVLSPEAARRVSGRWHEAGATVIYACESCAAAMPEKLAQWNGVFPDNQHFVEIGIPRGVSWEVATPDIVPGRDLPDCAAPRSLARAW